MFIVHTKDKNLPEEYKGKFGFGSVWTWTAICADTKLMVSWLVGEHSAPYAIKFIDDLASRLAHRVQLTDAVYLTYSCCGTRTRRVMGNPDGQHIELCG